MTKFDGTAISARGGRPTGLTTKDLKKNMQVFIETGQHPDIEQKRQRDVANSSTTTPLPAHDANRDFIFMDMVLSNRPLGRLVIELFVDMIPVGSNHLRNRVQPGSAAGLQGASISKLLPGYAIWLGKSPRASEGMCMQTHALLKHSEEGAVSISLNGDEVAIALGRALALNSTHQVVGRVHKGLEVLKEISGLPTNHEDVPVKRLQVARCGVTNAQGTFEEVDDPESTTGPKKDTAELLQEASAGARQSVLDALQDALAKQGPGKRPAQQSEAQQRGGGRGGGKGGGGGSNAKKAKYMDAMLGELSGSGSSSEEDDQ